MKSRLLNGVSMFPIKPPRPFSIAMADIPSRTITLTMKGDCPNVTVCWSYNGNVKAYCWVNGIYYEDTWP